ncbi:MAG: hypothetical protein Q7U02_06435 [Desulfosalsimonadaceae bacterium]|nr:hypothetical protein [Desulfosalsimonadaceae bacterium]
MTHQLLQLTWSVDASIAWILSRANASFEAITLRVCWEISMETRRLASRDADVISLTKLFPTR